MPAGSQTRQGVGGIAVRHVSGPGPSDQSAEAAFAPAIFDYGTLQRRPIEVRPVCWYEYQLAVGSLPQQEIGETLLTTGADDQIGVGQVGSIEIARNLVGRDRAYRQIARH